MTTTHMVEHVASCRSTIEAVREHLRNHRMATVTADHQTEGRGRHGRTWVDSPGTAVLASVATSEPIPADALVGIDGRIAREIARELERRWPELAGLVSVKDPNDVLVGDRKIAGVLVTTRTSGDVSDETILSVGLNVQGAPAPDRLRDGAARTPTSLHDHVPHAPVADARELVVGILERLLGELAAAHS